MYNLTATAISKRFGDRRVLQDVSVELQTGQSIALVGPNGSGKSTLLMILLGHVRPTRGSVSYRAGGQELSSDAFRAHASLVAPYLNLYDPLTAEENLTFFATVAGVSLTGKEKSALLARIGLDGRGADLVSAYSSGMKQRLKYAVALINQPAFLFLDEPTANLDDDGKQRVQEVIDEYRKRSIVVVATNEPDEQKWVERVCRVNG